MLKITDNIAYLSNEFMSLILKARDDGKIELVHFGIKVLPDDALALATNVGIGYGNSILYKEKDSTSCLERIPLFMSENSRGDYRESFLELFDEGKLYDTDFQFEGFIDVSSEKLNKTNSGLPLAHDAINTLKIRSSYKGLVLDQYISVFENAFSFRSVLINNEKDLTLSKISNVLLDLKGDFEMMSFGGGWIKEAHKEITPILHSKTINESNYGFSSSIKNPGVILKRKETSEDFGECFGINIIYSGNHYTSAKKSYQDITRVVSGINPEHFFKDLKLGEMFETPETVVTYSTEGLNSLSFHMHNFVLSNVIPKYWNNKERPIVYNSWEGCMFDFNEGKLLSLAKKAKKLGCEVFVLDDGWFGERNDDTKGLGDYEVNKRKLPNGLKALSDKLSKLDLQFGLWFEPEAVNPDSKLYIAHPDWAIHQNGLSDLYGRNELLLDLRKPEVRDYIVENVGRIIDENNISYVKWDMNRESSLFGNDAHEYILGLYDVLDRIFTSRPEVLLETCSSGGNRFDLGMLSFGPSVWASDDTDPLERLDIQEGYSYLYPLSCISCHVSASPHAQTLRHTPLSTRFNVAAFGILGYELDLEFLTKVEEEEIASQIRYYKEHRKLFQYGSFKRLINDNFISWQLSNDDEAVVGVFHKLVNAASPYEYLRADVNIGLYKVESKAQNLKVGDFGGLLKHILPVTLNPNGLVINVADKNYKMEDMVYKTECSYLALKSGIQIPNLFLGTGYSKDMRMQSDFGSNLFYIKKVD